MPTEQTQSQVVPGAVRTASVLIAAEAVSIASDLGFDLDKRVANGIGLGVALIAYVVLRFKELKGKNWATRVLGLGLAKAPVFKPVDQLPPVTDE